MNRADRIVLGAFLLALVLGAGVVLGRLIGPSETQGSRALHVKGISRAEAEQYMRLFMDIVWEEAREADPVYGPQFEKLYRPTQEKYITDTLKLIK